MIVADMYSFLDCVGHCVAARACRHLFRCSALPAASPYELAMPLMLPTRQHIGFTNCMCADASLPGVTVHWKPARVAFLAKMTLLAVARWLASGAASRRHNTDVPIRLDAFCPALQNWS